MENRPFVNRERELAFLEERYRSGRFEFASLIGRRRVGKTELVRHFLANKPASLYHYVPLGDERQHRLGLARALADRWGLPFVGEPTWEELFSKILPTSERRVLVLDEFQRLAAANPAVPSLLQHAIDSAKGSSRLMLLVLGSSIGMMHRLFESGAALYGRRTGALQLKPFSYLEYREWFPRASEEQRIGYYAYFGGTPHYLSLVNERRTPLENAVAHALSRGGVLYDEPEVLLRTELPDAREFLEVLKLLSLGKNTIKELGDALAIQPTSLSYYLHALEKTLTLVERLTPANEDPRKSKRGRYVITDPFFRFWFRYVLPNRSMLELGETRGVERVLGEERNAFVGRAFEEVVRELVARSAGLRLAGLQLPLFERVGSWWDRAGNEIDVCAVAKRERTLLLGEASWSNKPTPLSDARKLVEEKSPLVPDPGERFYLLASKAGFTPDCHSYAREHRIVLLDLNGLAKAFDALHRQKEKR